MIATRKSKFPSRKGGFFGARDTAWIDRHFTRGRKISVESFRQFYQKVIGLQIYDTWVSEVEQDAYMVIEYQYYGENKKDTIIFYNIQDNGRACLVHVNGEAIGLIRKTTLDELAGAAGEISQ